MLAWTKAIHLPYDRNDASKMLVILKRVQNDGALGGCSNEEKGLDHDDWIMIKIWIFIIGIHHMQIKTFYIF